MSMDTELLNEFVVESRENLDQVEPDLLALDTNAEAPDQELINRIFRAVHSVKGAAGYFGLESINKLSHAMENLLMKVRDGVIKITPAMVDQLLLSNDRLRSLVDDAQNSNDVDITAEVALVESFLSEDGGSSPAEESKQEPEAKQATTAESSSPTTGGSRSGLPFDLDPAKQEDAIKNGRHFYRLEIKLQEDLLSKNRKISDFIKNVESLGEILHQQPNQDELNEISEEELRSLVLEIYTLSILGPDVASVGFDLGAESIHEISLKELSSEDASAPTVSEAEEQGAKTQASPGKNAAPKGKASGTKSSSKTQKTTIDETVRVKTRVLNSLMDMAGEMVLGRNRLVRVLDSHLDQIDGVGPVLHQVSSITTQIQELIMRTRLQPIGGLFGKFHRVIRDISGKLGKEVILETHGDDVELDRTILEALSDPLTHLIRNSLDHGVEPPAEREKQGKPRQGVVRLEAAHEAGMVNINIVDDGHGIDVARVKEKAIEKDVVTEEELDRMSDREIMKLIFAPGFSTAQAITDVSGRGVGMDVVRTNIEKLGGIVELDSTLGRGSTFTLKLPLTLAIVSSLIVESENQRFALPQVGLEEVIRLVPSEAAEKIERVRDANVLRHRGKLLPLVRLKDVLDLRATYIDPVTGERKVDRRKNIADRRSGENDVPQAILDRRSGNDRRESSGSTQRILVLRAGRDRFGLMVDQILDAEEIVVKPLSRFIRNLPCFSGTTILGDGRISMILDPVGIVQASKLKFMDLEADRDAEAKMFQRQKLRETQNLLLFTSGAEEILAMPLPLVERIEKIESSIIERVGGKEYLKYRGTSLPLIRLHDYLPVGSTLEDPPLLNVIIPKLLRKPIGIITPQVLDAVETDVKVDRETIQAQGLIGSTILNDKIVLLLDIYGILDQAEPDYRDWSQATEILRSQQLNVLLVEDTPFFQMVEKDYLEAAGLQVTVVSDGEEAWEKLERESFDIVVSDLIMPNLDGFGLLERIRGSERFQKIPVIALTAMNRDEDRIRGMEAGFNDYQTKLDKESLLESISAVVGAEA